MHALCQLSTGATIKIWQVSDVLQNFSSRADILIEDLYEYVNETRALFKNIAVLTKANETIIKSLATMNNEMNQQLRNFQDVTDMVERKLTEKLSAWKVNAVSSSVVTVIEMQEYLNQTDFFTSHKIVCDLLEEIFSNSLILHHIVIDNLNASSQRVNSVKQQFEIYINESNAIRGKLVIESAKLGSNELLEIIDEIQAKLNAQVFEYDRQTTDSVMNAQVAMLSINKSSHNIIQAQEEVLHFTDQLKADEYFVNHELIRLQIEHELRTASEMQEVTYKILNNLNSRIDVLNTHLLYFTRKITLFKQILGNGTFKSTN